MEYGNELIKRLAQPGTVLDVQGLAVECKPVPDGGEGELDPRELLRRESLPAARRRADMTLEEERDSMGGFNYSLNRKEVWTSYILVPTTYGEVPVWCYRPRRMGQGRPALVYAHGGGFFGGSIYAVENQCKLIAERADCMVWNVDYALAPDYPYPVACTQFYEVTKYLHENAARFGVDPARITVAGDSAGGNLAAAAAQMDRDQGYGCISGQVLIYAKLAFFNQDLPGYVWDEQQFPIIREQRRFLPAMLALGVPQADEHCTARYIRDADDAHHPYASPAYGTAEKLPKALFLQAEYDGLRLEGEYYARKLMHAGVPIRMVRYCGTCHAFFDALGILPQAEAAVDEICDFIEICNFMLN